MSATPETIMPLAWPVSKGCRRAGIGETKFREAIKAGEMEVLQIGDMMLVEDDEIRRWLASKRKRAA
jgi:hypothetical protein